MSPPHVGPTALGGLLVEISGIVVPFWVPAGALTAAVWRGLADARS